MDDVDGAGLDQHGAAQPVHLPADDDDRSRIAAAAQERDGVGRVVGGLQVVVEEDQLGLALDDAVERRSERTRAAHLDRVAEHDVERGAQAIGVEVLVLDDEHIRGPVPVLLRLCGVTLAGKERTATPLHVFSHCPKTSASSLRLCHALPAAFH
mgnify:CR=1 FL=1